MLPPLPRSHNQHAPHTRTAPSEGRSLASPWTAIDDCQLLCLVERAPRDSLARLAVKMKRRPGAVRAALGRMVSEGRMPDSKLPGWTSFFARCHADVCVPADVEALLRRPNPSAPRLIRVPAARVEQEPLTIAALDPPSLGCPALGRSDASEHRLARSSPATPSDNLGGSTSKPDDLLRKSLLGRSVLSFSQHPSLSASASSVASVHCLASSTASDASTAIPVSRRVAELLSFTGLGGSPAGQVPCLSEPQPALSSTSSSPADHDTWRSGPASDHVFVARDTPGSCAPSNYLTSAPAHTHATRASTTLSRRVPPSAAAPKTTPTTASPVSVFTSPDFALHVNRELRLQEVDAQHRRWADELRVAQAAWDEVKAEQAGRTGPKRRWSRVAEEVGEGGRRGSR